MAKRQVPLRLEEELIEEIDRVRGDVPRERWIRRLIEQKLGINQPEPQPTNRADVFRAAAQKRGSRKDGKAK